MMGTKSAIAAYLSVLIALKTAQCDGDPTQNHQMTIRFSNLTISHMCPDDTVNMKITCEFTESGYSSIHNLFRYSNNYIKLIYSVMTDQDERLEEKKPSQSYSGSDIQDVPPINFDHRFSSGNSKNVRCEASIEGKVHVSTSQYLTVPIKIYKCNVHKAPLEFRVSQGDTVSFTTTEGTNLPTLWKRNGQPLESANNYTQTKKFWNVQQSDAGEYICTTFYEKTLQGIRTNYTLFVYAAAKPVQNLAVPHVNATSASLTWAPQKSESPYVLREPCKYIVSYKTLGSSAVTERNTTEQAINISPLKPDTVYEVSVSAENKQGTSEAVFTIFSTGPKKGSKTSNGTNVNSCSGE